MRALHALAGRTAGTLVGLHQRARRPARAHDKNFLGVLHLVNGRGADEGAPHRLLPCEWTVRGRVSTQANFTAAWIRADLVVVGVEDSVALGKPAKQGLDGGGHLHLHRATKGAAGTPESQIEAVVAGSGG